MDAFTAMAEPVRRRILDELRTGERDVGELAAAVVVSQSAMSKHLRVLREAGIVARRVAAQRRLYSVDPGGLQPLEEWLRPYRQMWGGHLDALERHLDSQEER
jgi:DNA-binding transcriptional ArsR family regulator